MKTPYICKLLNCLPSNGPRNFPFWVPLILFTFVLGFLTLTSPHWSLHNSKLAPGNPTMNSSSKIAINLAQNSLGLPYTYSTWAN